MGFASRGPEEGTVRQRLWRVIFLSDTFAGQLFNVTPVTIAGELMSCVIMLTGFAIIAVPTGW